MEFTSVDGRGIVRGKCSVCACPKYTVLENSRLKCLKCEHPPGRHDKVEDVDMEIDYDLASGAGVGETSHQYESQLPSYYILSQQEQFHWSSDASSTSSPHATNIPQGGTEHNFSKQGGDMISNDYNLESLQHTLDYLKCVHNRNVQSHISNSTAGNTISSLSGVSAGLAEMDIHSQPQNVVQQGTSVESWQNIWPLNCANEQCTRNVYVDDELPQYLQEFKYCSPLCRDKVMQDVATKNTAEKIVLLEAKLHGATDSHSLSKYLISNPGTCSTCSEKSKSSATAESTSKQSGSMAQEDTSQQWPPRCVNKLCERNVYVDYELPQHLREFKYCSPLCRDKDMQDVVTKSTVEGIVLLESKLQGTANCLSLSRYLASNSGDCSICSKKGKSNTRDTSKQSKSVAQGARKEQASVRIRVMKDSYKEDMGIILCKTDYVIGTIHGFFVSGIVRDKQAYKTLMNEKEGLGLLDVIICVENISVKPSNLDRLFDEKTYVNVDCYRSLGIPLDLKILTKVQYYSHIFAIRCASQSETGITLLPRGSEISIDVKEGSIAKNSGLLSKDVVTGFVAAKRTIQASEIVVCSDYYNYRAKEKFKKCIEETLKNKSNLIVFIKRCQY